MCLRDAEGRLRPDLWVVLVVLHCMLSTALGPLIGFLSWAVVVVAPKPLPYSCSGTFGLALFGNSVVSDTDCSLSAPPSAYNYVWTGLVFCITPALLTRLFVTTTCCCLPRNYAALCAIATLCVCFVSELVAIGCASTYLPISIAPWQASLTNDMIIATMTAEPALYMAVVSLPSALRALLASLSVVADNFGSILFSTGWGRRFPTGRGRRSRRRACRRLRRLCLRSPCQCTTRRRSSCRNLVDLLLHLPVARYLLTPIYSCAHGGSARLPTLSAAAALAGPPRSAANMALKTSSPPSL